MMAGGMGGAQQQSASESWCVRPFWERKQSENKRSFDSAARAQKQAQTRGIRSG
jgi:hypothetical protein